VWSLSGCLARRTRDRASRRQRLRTNGSILDSVTASARALERELGATDRVKLTEYLDAVREIEHGIQRAEAQTDIALPRWSAPRTSRGLLEHVNLMFDLQVLAYQADMTRVMTFMLSREVSARSYPEIGVPDATIRYRTISRIPPGWSAWPGKHVPYVTVRQVSGEAAGDAGRGRDVARSRGDSLWLRHERRQYTQSRGSADLIAGGVPARSRVAAMSAAPTKPPVEPAPDAVEPYGDSGRSVW